MQICHTKQLGWSFCLVIVKNQDLADCHRGFFCFVCISLATLNRKNLSRERAVANTKFYFASIKDLSTFNRQRIFICPRHSVIDHRRETFLRSSRALTK